MNTLMNNEYTGIDEYINPQAPLIHRLCPANSLHAFKAPSGSLPPMLEWNAWPRRRENPGRNPRPQAAWMDTVLHRGMGTGISEASKRVPIFSFATQRGKQVSSHFRQRNWVQA